MAAERPEVIPAKTKTKLTIYLGDISQASMHLSCPCYKCGILIVLSITLAAQFVMDLLCK